MTPTLRFCPKCLGTGKHRLGGPCKYCAWKGDATATDRDFCVEFTQLTPLDPQTFTMCERPGCFNTCVRGNLNCREHVQPSFIQRRHGYGCPCAACNAPK